MERRVGWEFGQMGEMRAERENERKEKREIKWEFAQIWVPWQFCIAENDQKLPSRDPPDYKSITSQKPCFNNRCQVAVLEELAWMANSIAAYSKRNECSVRFRVPWE